MKTLTRWFLYNPVASNLLMIFILVAGLLTFNTLRVESFPKIPPSELIISVVYHGGTAKQVDEGITQRIEEAINDIAGIKSITSESHRGHAIIKVKKNTGIKLDRLIEDIRNQIGSIIGFPEQAEVPQIYRNEFGNLASFVIVYGGQDQSLLQEVSTRLQTLLKRHPAISKIEHLGKRKRQLVIKPNVDMLKLYGLNIEAIANHIHQWSLDYRSGELKTARGIITIRGSNFADNLLELKSIPIISTKNSFVTLNDIASITRGFEETESIVRFQGKPAIALLVTTSQKDNLFKVSKAIREVIEDFKPSLPIDVNLDVMADMTPYISEQLDLLGTNAWQGLLIVLILLSLFLEVKFALWVALGIPVSIFGAIWLMGLSAINYSINDITLFGMILVLGILVDDAVVVGESIHQSRQTIRDPQKAAWLGVKNVTTTTVFGTLTTIAAFSPMLWIENELAKVLSGFSAVVIFSLIFSLIESKFILPTHLSFPKKNNLRTNFFSRSLKNHVILVIQDLTYFHKKCISPYSIMSSIIKGLP